MKTSLEQMYRVHHATKRGEGFALLGKERGEFLRKHIGTGKKVLDIGCRDGALTGLYAKGNDVLGLDIDSDALKRAEHTLGIQVRQVDLNGDWNISEGSFDVVVAAEVVEHLYYPEVVIGKIAHALRKDGIALITVPNAFSIKNRLRYLMKRKRGTPLMDPTHINHFTVKELETLCLARFARAEVLGIGRFPTLARLFPQAFAFDLCVAAYGPK